MDWQALHLLQSTTLYRHLAAAEAADAEDVNTLSQNKKADATSYSS